MNTNKPDLNGKRHCTKWDWLGRVKHVEMTVRG